MTEPSIRVLSTESLSLGEGIRFVDDRFVLVDLEAGRLLSHSGQDREPYTVLATVPGTIGAVAPVLGRPGRWIAATSRGIARLDADGALTWVATPEDAYDGRTRANDGAADPSGRYWMTSMAFDGESPLGSLYRLDPDNGPECVLHGYPVLNGPAFSADGQTVYVNDTAGGQVLQIEADRETGPTSDPVQLVQFGEGEGQPDGMAVDSAGNLWIAMYDGAAVRCIDPSGETLQVIDLPARYPTSVSVQPGYLVVTTGRRDDPDPAAGHLLRVDVPDLEAVSAVHLFVDHPEQL